MSRDTAHAGPEPTVRGVTGARAAMLVLGWSLASLLARKLGIWPAMGSAAVLLGALSLRWDGRRLMGAGRHASMVPLGGLVGLVMAAVTLVLYGPVARWFPTLSADVARLYELLRSPGIMGAFLLMPVVLTCEELVWRGAVHAAISHRTSRLSAAVVGTALYTLSLVPYGSPALVLAAFGAGSCWTLLRAYSDSLPAVIAAHAVWSYSVLVFWPSSLGA